MKKSLVALAALAVVGAASAQVTITGTTSFSYETNLNGVAGLAMTDNSIFLGDTEDLGGGTKLVMSTGFDAGGRGNQTSGGGFGAENSSLTVSGGFGSLKVQSYESDGPLAAIEGLSGASLDTGMFDTNAVGLAKRFRYGLTYSAPSMAGFTPALTYVTLANQFASTDPLDAKTKVVPAVTYSAGPLTAYVEYALFNATYNNTPDDQVTQPSATITYDFGVATVGAGWTKPSNNNATAIVGVSVPLGAVTLGLSTATWNQSTAATWTEASVGYALSKRTSLKASFGAINDAAVANTNTGLASAATYGYGTGLTQNCEYRIGLFHSF